MSSPKQITQKINQIPQISATAKELSYPEGDDGVKNPPELTGHGEVRQDGGEGEVTHDPSDALAHAPPAAAKEGASPGSSSAKPPPLLPPRHSPRQRLAFPQELAPVQRPRRGTGPI